MSQSIFHVRPLDAGKGWAIDEYDGRGAWQRSVLKTPEGAPMDKIQAQRAVFQLRRKAVNSVPTAEPVNKVGAVNKGTIPSSEDGLKRLRDGVAHPAGLLPPYIQSEMVLCDPDTGLMWKVESCSGFPSEPQGVVANLVEPGRSRTVPCSVLRTWPLGEDWTDEDEDEEEAHAG